MISRIAIASALLVLLAACGSTATSTPIDEQSGAATAPPVSPSAAQESPQPDAPETGSPVGEGGLPLAVLTRSGGITGSTETLVVQNDGQIQVIAGEIGGQALKEGRASAKQIETLRAAVQSEEWQQLDAMYGEQVPDGYAYTIVANAKMIMTYDGAQNPPVVDDVLNQLNELWQQALAG